jgi:hypothetical protein
MPPRPCAAGPGRHRRVPETVRAAVARSGADRPRLAFRAYLPPGEGERTAREFADHGRPYGGRQGGEFAVQRVQGEPRARGTSASGGSDRNGTDPGEYF